MQVRICAVLYGSWLPRVCIGTYCNNTVYTIDKAVKMTTVTFGLIYLLKLVQHDYPTPTAASIRPPAAKPHNNSVKQENQALKMYEG